jgi:signal transduction histidine kinase
MVANELRVLLVEDNPGDARLIEEMLRETGGRLVLERATRLSECLDSLAQRPAGVVLLDLGLPDSLGLDTFLRARTGAPGVAFIVLTGLDDQAIADRAIHEGAQDYLIKGKLDGEQLLRSIRYAMSRHEIEARLRLVVRELERKMQELDAFTYSVSHDLKEPLRTLEAFSQFLLEDYSETVDERGREYLQKLAGASARMKRQIEDLLALARLSRRAEAPGRVSLQRVVEAVVDGLRLVIEERGAVVQIEDGLPDVLADETRVEQIVGNLVGNALKFNESDRPQVRIGARAVDGETATLFVQDNGIGIDPAYHDRIFGVFQRLHQRDVYPGTGAGLAIVKRAVESLGGRVWVESSPGAGAAFLFTLPVWRDALVGAPLQAAA